MFDVPIIIYPADEINATVLPEMTTFPDVTIYMPPMKVLKSVVERMKNISETLVISNNRAGEMTLTVETSVVSVKTYFKDLERAEMNEDQQDGAASLQTGGAAAGSQAGSADTEFIHSTVAIKSLHTFFSAFQHPPRDILLSVFKNEMVVLFVSNDDYNIYCYVPMRAED